MSRTYDFVQYDVFTRTLLTGNPLAIFSNAHGLADQEMQALARAVNLSATTFSLPRDADSEAREGKKMRIFTAEEELPFAGHPTLGSALYLYAAERQPRHVVFDLRVGKVRVDLPSSRTLPDAPMKTVRSSGKCASAIL